MKKARCADEAYDRSCPGASGLLQYLSGRAQQEMAHGPENWTLRAAHDISSVTWCAGTAMRRASNRIPKRSLEPHFEMSHSAPNPKGRTARRGPTGSSKAHKASYTCAGAILTLNTEGHPALIVHHLKEYTLLPCMLRPWQEQNISLAFQEVFCARRYTCMRGSYYIKTASVRKHTL